MVQALSVTSRSKIGWKAVSLALNAIVVSIAFVVLYRTLRNVDPAERLGDDGRHVSVDDSVGWTVRGRRLCDTDVI